MADLAKKILKHAADTLEPGEQVLETAIVTPRGAMARQAVAGGVGGVVGLGVAAAMDKKRRDIAPEAPEGTWADQFPKRKVFLSVTDRRLVVHAFGEMMGRPKELLGWVPREVVHAVQMEKAKLAHKGTLWFSDGSAYEIDVARAGGEPDRLGRALGLHP